ncbi:helix-turn-helix transcriptional regulator [Xanthobacter sp. V0B-10]|uniref:helix-turn-helix domain-containing protein n=1 Tax=Xanthobacter albus TaxID=3119929 RepID=UPI003726AA4B
MTLAENLKRLREEMKLSQPKLAKAAGVSQQLISRLENGKDLTTKKLPNLARALGVTVTDLDPTYMLSDVGTEVIPEPASEAPTSLPSPDASHPVPLRFSHKTIPVYGHAAGGMNEDGKFILNGSKIADVLCPPALETVAGAYAVYHTGESMLPRYEPGDLLTIHPSLPVKRGDYVLVQITGDDGDPPYGYVKRFVSRNAKELVLEQLNPPEGEDSILRFPADRVLTVHVIWGASRG